MEDIQNLKDGSRRKNLAPTHENKPTTRESNTVVYKNSSTSFQGLGIEEANKETVVDEHETQASETSLRAKTLLMPKSADIGQIIDGGKIDEAKESSAIVWCCCFEQKNTHLLDTYSLENASRRSHPDKTSDDIAAIEDDFETEVKCKTCHLEIREPERRRERIIELWMDFFGSSQPSSGNLQYCSSI